MSSTVNAALAEAWKDLWNGDLSFTEKIIADEEHMVVRWKAHGTYSGGFPGASPDAVGREVTFTGTDTLRIADGMLAEYRANADSLLFFQQLGIREVPGQGAR